MANKIQIRRDTAANWTATNPVLSQGELGFETTTGKLKVGDGIKTWAQLDYLIGEADGSINLGAVDKHVLPATDNVYDLGSPTKQWRDLYVSNGSIYVGDVKITNEAGRLIFTQVTNPGQPSEQPVPGGTEAFELPVASASILGGIKVGANLSITEEGVLSAEDGNYTLPTASNTVKGGIKVGDNLSIDGEGFLSAVVPNQSLNTDDNVTFDSVGAATVNVSQINGTNPGDELVIQANNNNWTFGTDGTLSLPEGMTTTVQADQVTIKTNDGDLTLESDSDVFVKSSAGENTWQFGTDGNLSFPGGSTVRDIPGETENDSLLLLGAGTTIDENVRAARIGINGSVEGVVIGAGSNDWLFTNDGRLTLPQGGDIKDSEGNSVLGGGIEGVEIIQDVDTTVLTKRSEDTITEGEASQTTITESQIEIDPTNIVITKKITEISNDGVITATDVAGSSLEVSDSGAFVKQYVEPSGPSNSSYFQIRANNGAVLEGVQEQLAGNNYGRVTATQGIVAVNTAAGGIDKEWVFDSDGNLTLPAEGDILDSNGDSVLGGGGGGEPTISNTLKGFINLVGDRPNDSDDAWFESVVVRGNYAYVLGSDYYINNSNDRAKVYKFDVRTGEQVWVKQITAGRGATFDISIGEGTIVINGITQMGQDYKAGEEIPFDGYQVGGNAPDNSFIIVADTVDEFGGVLTASVKPGYNAGAISYNSTVSSYYDDAQGDTVAISYDDFNNKLIVLQEYGSGRGDVNDGFWTWANVYVVDPETGVIDQTVTLSDEGDIFPNSIATLEVDGGIAIVGEKYNEYRDFGPLTILAGGIGYFDILKSNLDPEHYPGAPFNNYSDFWITGTGIASQENVDNINFYNGLPSTVQQGSGAQFQVVSAGDGIPYVSALATVPNKGSNYLVGHKIKILGTALGGATPANDAIITVTEIGEGGSIEAVTVSGTGGDVGGGTYNGLTGTNHNTGSGAYFYTQYNGNTGITSFFVDATGINYVVGDILIIAGTNFANGTSPANDVEIEVTNVDGAGGVIAMQVNVDDIPTDALRIHVYGVDFTVEGTWSMKQNLGGEAFIWTPAWTNAIGGPSGDRFYDVTWSADGTALYAVGRGRYETNYDQALVVKFDATDGSIVWSKDIKFTEATTVNRQARAVCLVPNSTDIMVGGEWSGGESSEIILTRITAAGTAVWQKTYAMEAQGNPQWVDPEMSLKAADDNIVVSFEQGTNGDSSGLAYMVINPNNGTVIRHRVFSSDSAGNRVYYNTPTANISDIYSDATGDYVVMAGYTYVPTDNYYNSLLMKLPLDGLVNIDADERWSIGEHIMNRHTVNVTTVTPAFESFTADQHIDTITNTVDARNYVTRTPDGELKVWTQTITNDSAGYLEFGDGSKQSFATNVIPQINAQRDYWLTTQDSGKHIFFEHEYGTVYIPHSSVRYFPVGFTFTIVNTTGSDCYLRSQNGMWTRAIFKLAGRNITTVDIGIPDSGSGSMITVMKIKDGYEMVNSDNDNSYPDIWMVSGPSDIYDNND